MEPIKILLKDDEYCALSRLAEQDIRSIRDAAHWIIREELTRRGLLKMLKEQAPDA